MFKVGDLVKGTEAGSEEYSHTGQDMLKAEVTAAAAIPKLTQMTQLSRLVQGKHWS